MFLCGIKYITIKRSGVPALIFLSVIFSSPVIIAADTKRTDGIGITIGNVAGVSFKHFLYKKKNALDAAFSVTDGKLHLMASYLWHDYEALPPVEEGELPLVYGAAAGIYLGKAAVGGVVGVSYIFKEDYPFDIFLHLLPVVVFDSSASMNFQGALGARYYFK